MGYFSEVALEIGHVVPSRVWRAPVQGPLPLTAAERLGFKFNERVHLAINLRAWDQLPAHMRRGPRWMVIGFRYDNPGPGIPVLRRHFYGWGPADQFADRLIEADVLQLAYLKEY